MASNWEQITHQGQPARKYPDGSIRNERGHPLPGTKIPNDGHEITIENTHEYARARQEQKRAAVIAAANDAVQSGELRLKHGDMAFVAEIVSTAMMKATTPEDPKAIDAARFLIQEAGLSDKQAQQAESPIGEVRGIISDLARMIEALPQLHATQTQPKDSQLLRTDILISNNDAHSSADVDAGSSPTDTENDGH